MVRSKERFVVLKEINDFLCDPKTEVLLALMSQRKLYERDYDIIVFIVSSVINVPAEIEKYVSYVEMDVLGEDDEDEIKRTDWLISYNIILYNYELTRYFSSFLTAI